MIIKTDPDIIKSYLEDSSNLKGGYADQVVIPSTVEELRAFVTKANLSKTPITISGGGTATTGSRIPFGGSVISVEKLNKIAGIYPEKSCALVQTGVLVDHLKSECEKYNLFYTSHPTERTATIGGTVSTNASGSRSLKYGSTRRFIKWLRMVMATGEAVELRRGENIINTGNLKMVLPGGRVVNMPLPSYTMPDVKSSAGYYFKPGMDLIDLFIGQEGTLSIIVDVEFGLIAKPANILSSFVFFDNEMDARAFAKDAKNDRDVLSVEYFDSNSLALLYKKFKNLPPEKKAAIFFECESDKEDIASVAERWAGVITKNASSVDDTRVAMNDKDAELFADIRHALPELVNDIYRKFGFSKLSTDIAVPDDKFDELMDFYSDSFRGESLDHVIFGHIGESHVHVNMLPKSVDEVKRSGDLSLEFIKKGLALGGTVSAEHGIGKLKHKYLEEMYGRQGVLEMARLKKAFDPNCILGLDNIFPKEYLSLV